MSCSRSTTSLVATDCTLPADRPCLIRLEGAAGEVRIEVQSAFALRMNLTDETSGQTQEISGKGNGTTLTAAVNGQAGKTWLIAVAALLVIGLVDKFHLLDKLR